MPLGPHPEGKPRPAGVDRAIPARMRELVGGPAPDEGELAQAIPACCSATTTCRRRPRGACATAGIYTGDVCRRDADGFYYFVGRTDDMFVSGGENIFPGEVEALLERHPACTRPPSCRSITS